MYTQKINDKCTCTSYMADVLSCLLRVHVDVEFLLAFNMIIYTDNFLQNLHCQVLPWVAKNVRPSIRALFVMNLRSIINLKTWS